jgi:hypothetical protein
MLSNKIKQRLDSMLGNTYKYAGHIHYFKDYSIKNDEEKVVIVTNQKSFTKNFESVPEFLDYFELVENVLPQKQQPSIVQSAEPAVADNESMANKLTNILLENISKVQESPLYIPQANTINSNINSIVNIMKLKLQVEKQTKKRQ